MAIQIRTTAQAINAPVGRHTTETPGLSLVVASANSRRWIYRYYAAGRTRRDVTLGTPDTHTLEQAVAQVALWKAGAGEPTAIAPKAQAVAQVPLGADPVRWECRTFGEAWEAYVEHLETVERRASKTLGDWERTLRLVFPSIREKLVLDVTVADMVDCLRPYWFTKATTARKSREKAHTVLGREFRRLRSVGREARYRSVARKFEINPVNPADYEELRDALPPQEAPQGRLVSERAKAAGHRGGNAACNVPTAGRLLHHIACMRRRSSTANAVRLALYTGARPGMVRFASWEQFDLTGRRWVIPGSVMKMNFDHAVYLSDGALEVLKDQGPKPAGLVFPGLKGGEMSMTTFTRWLNLVAEKMGVPRFTCHGFRTTFTTWCKRTGQSADIREAILAHKVKGMSAHYTDILELADAQAGVLDAWYEALAAAAAEAALA